MIRMVRLGCIVFFAGLLIMPYASASEEDKAIAGSTDEKGIYHITTVFKSIDRVEWKDDEGTIHSLSNGDWSYDGETSRLKIHSDTEVKRFTVYGKRMVPWAWISSQPLCRDSVKILLEDKTGVRGKDFEVDEAKGLVRLLDGDRCTKDLNYYMTWCMSPDPENSPVAFSSAFGNHKDKKRVEQFLAPDKVKKNERRTIRSMLTKTEKPLEYSLDLPLEAEGMKITVFAQESVEKVKWEKLDAKFRYKSGSGVIEFLAEPQFDPTKEALIAIGYPVKPKKIFTFDEPLPMNSVFVTLNGRQLKEGEGFLVDYIDGRVAILDDAITEKGVKYMIGAGSVCIGN